MPALANEDILSMMIVLAQTVIQYNIHRVGTVAEQNTGCSLLASARS
jgi:hypothetical protein